MRQFCYSYCLVLVLISSPLYLSFSQGSTEYGGGLKVTLNEDGSKYFRVISWGQFWLNYNDGITDENTSKTSISVRRARVLTFAQINKKFLILTHFGLNSLSGANTHPLGKNESSQLFFHDFWGQYTITKNHAIGAGLHYWNGISRLSNQSTLNMLTLDNNRQSWATLALSDQFARHIGIYAKGKFGKLQYRIAVNEAGANTADTSEPTLDGAAVYQGRARLGSKDAGFAYAGYFDYHFLDQESNFLPYKVGSYIGSKKVFNIGAGFFTHPNGSVINDGGDFKGQDVVIFAVDAFYDAPIGNNGSAITAYAVYQNTDYGRNYVLGSTYATGSMFYGHLGYLVPGNKEHVRFQPYLSFNTRSIKAIDDNATRFGVGGNLYLTGHHAKVSLEYNNTKYPVPSGSTANEQRGALTIQAMIYL